ncbi:MCE family protein [Nostoc sp. FACHB-152]|uniref:MlaD family protein n=1 Tax=unclassified Nostoc TaxID=2593658 RepID=UPI001687EAD9|nr:MULTISPECIES: MlaD family protein [unclassified Nostoc]MBD2451503.1 MCE family protein [Nostoc sp. FACHB-152]MBD2468633.1 MCE family protein [Nostoc sp. FACHB-145]
MRDFITNRFTSRRTLREGSVGLLILLGLGSFAAILLWLNGVNARGNSYKFIVEFANAGGMQRGATVRYRGVKVGRISNIVATANAIEVEVEITPDDLIIPNDVIVEANQSGLISESIVDIRPRTTFVAQVKAKPVDKNCNPSLIVCNGSRLKGQIGISIDDLIRSTTELSNLYNDPKFYQRVNRLLESSSAAATSVALLSQDLRGLSKSFQGQVGTFGSTANSIQRATNQLTATTTKTANQLGVTASQFGTTAQQFGATASTANRLLTNLDELVTNNRSSLVSALNNITETSNQLRVAFSTLSPSLNRLTQGEVIKNLETLSANAAQASANLRNATQTLSDPKNALLLQQTLDSARVTFENTQKITSDLDELTGDPAFRENLRQLVNGLSGLVSSTQQMQQQVEFAATLDTLKLASQKPHIVLPTPPATEQATTIDPSTATVKSIDKEPQPTPPATLNASQEKLLQQLREYSKQREQNSEK